MPIKQTHFLFTLIVANDGQLPMFMYIELYVYFLGHNGVGFPITKDLNHILDEKN